MYMLHMVYGMHVLDLRYVAQLLFNVCKYSICVCAYPCICV